MQVTLKRDYIYKIENTDLEIGVSGVLLRILFYFEARRCSRQTGSLDALRINLLNIMIQRTLLRGRGTSLMIKLNDLNKKVKKKKKKKNLCGLELRTFLLWTLYKNHLTSQLYSANRFIICISTSKIPVKLTVNTESRRKVKISCALTVKLCTCVRLIKSDNKSKKNDSSLWVVVTNDWCISLMKWPLHFDAKWWKKKQ